MAQKAAPLGELSATRELISVAVGEDGVGGRVGPDGELKTFAGSPPRRFSLLAAHAAQTIAGDSDEFRLAIDVVIDGMLARAAEGTCPRKFPLASCCT